MNIDLSKCVIGRKVVTRDGEVGTFVGLSDWLDYPYKVKLPDTYMNVPRNYTCEGHWLSEPLSSPLDIVEILPLDGHCVSAPKLTPPSILESLKELGALRKENEALKVQIASILKPAEEASFEWRSGFPPLGKIVLVEFQGEEIEVTYECGAQLYWTALDFEKAWHPNAFNRWKYPAK